MKRMLTGLPMGGNKEGGEQTPDEGSPLISPAMSNGYKPESEEGSQGFGNAVPSFLQPYQGSIGDIKRQYKDQEATQPTNGHNGHHEMADSASSVNGIHHTHSPLQETAEQSQPEQVNGSHARPVVQDVPEAAEQEHMAEQPAEPPVPQTRPVVEDVQEEVQVPEPIPQPLNQAQPVDPLQTDTPIAQTPSDEFAPRQPQLTNEPEPQPAVVPEPEPAPQEVAPQPMQMAQEPEPQTQHEAEPVPQPLNQEQPAPEMPAQDAQAPQEPQNYELASRPEPQSVAAKKIVEENKPKETKKMRIGDKLTALGLISEDQLQIALQEQRQSKKLLGAVMVDMGFVTESALGEVLAESTGAKTFDPGSTMLDPILLKLMPQDVCMRHKIIPISQEANSSINLAMADVHDVIAIDQARRYLPKGVVINPLFCAEGKVMELITEYYQYELSIDGILKEIETGIRDNNQLDGRQEGYVNPTVRLVNMLLVDAIKQEASDIHFEPEGTFLRLRYRIDGKLQQIRSFHRDYWAAMCTRMKIMSGMNIAESRNAQDGRIGFKALGRDIDFRVATQPTVHGENVVLRILDKSKALMPLDKLGFTDHNMNLLKRCLKRPEGIVIVTGPTGSGKTTTLYSMLGELNSIDVNIMTLEDPVEYQLPLIRQTNVREGSVDFNSGIKSLMRQDPDIIFVGEVRDEDTALMSVRAALTGHQVFTTLHTNDALGAIPRLGDIGVPPHLLAGSLIASIAQRLARRLCTHCKTEYQASEEECKILGVDPSNPPMLYKSKGCEHCNNGYKGRTALIEILRVDEGMDELISTHATRNHMMEYALENGFIPMVQDGIAKVLEGEIDVKELIRTVDLTDRL